MRDALRTSSFGRVLSEVFDDIGLLFQQEMKLAKTEVSLIVAVMAGGDGSPTLARDTVFAVVMLVCNGLVGLCLVAADLLPTLLYPLASVGALALSVYTAQLVGLRVLDVTYAESWGRWTGFTLTALLLATMWRLRLGRGPLERLLTWSSRRAAGP